jgi:hypothetical protein
MGLTVFFALAILGIDFLIYALFQWTWGAKRRAIARQVAAHRKEYDTQPRRLFLVSRQGTPPASQHRSEIFPRNSPTKRIA